MAHFQGLDFTIRKAVCNGALMGKIEGIIKRSFRDIVFAQ